MSETSRKVQPQERGIILLLRKVWTVSHHESATGRETIYLDKLTMIVPVYEQPLMLAEQLATWACYDDHLLERIEFIVVDDCSPTPIEPIVRAANPRIQKCLYRMNKDVQWNRNICRNAAVQAAETEWVLNVDADHILPPLSALRLFEVNLNAGAWYRFPRWRIGAADETRRKDAIPDDCEFGEIKPHIDSHLMARELFMRSPYDPEYTGFLGGGSPFLARLQEIAPVELLPDSVHLYVHTRHEVADASILNLDRDTSRYKRLRGEKEMAKDTVPKKLFEHDWERVI